MPEAQPRPFKARDVVAVAGVPGQPNPAPGVVAADETTGLAYVKVAGCDSYPVDVIRLTLVTPAEPAPAHA
jgi:hypothetical protein